MKITNIMLIICSLMAIHGFYELNAKCQPIGTVHWRVVHPRSQNTATWIAKELEHFNPKLNRIPCTQGLLECEATQTNRSAAIEAANKGISQEEINAKMGEPGYKWDGQWRLDNGGTTGRGACVIRGKR